ncbi:MAG: hypothetical protein ABH883_00560 [Candidatus Omnitrophota bacterium]
MIHARSKILSCVICFTFLLTMGIGDITSRADAPRSSDVSPGIAGDNYRKINVDSFSVPEDLGKVKERIEASGNKIVIHIQDAHCNLPCQEKIFSLIQYFVDEYGINKINLEGASGPFDLGIFLSIRDDEIRRRTAEYFVKEGSISGAEFFAAAHPGKNAELWGVEDKDLYLADLGVYRTFLNVKDSVLVYLADIKNILGKMKEHVFNRELFELDSKYTGYQERTVTLKEFIKYLISLAGKEGLPLDGFPNIIAFSNTLKEEESVDFKKADSQRNRLISELKKNMSGNDLKKIAGLFADEKRKKLTARAINGYLKDKAEILGIDTDKYPEFLKYTGYLSSYSAIDKHEVMDEMRDLAAILKNRLFRENRERELDLLYGNTGILINFFDFSLTKEEYLDYMADSDDFSVTVFQEFIRRYGPECGIVPRAGRIADAEVEEYRGKVLDFYGLSFLRDKAFLGNIRFSRVKGGLEAAILVTGGFHADSLKELFLENGISFISVIPEFTMDSGYVSPYFRLLSGEEPDLERMISRAVFSADLIQVASRLSAAIADDVYGKDGRDIFDMAVRIVERFVVRDKKEIKDITGENRPEGRVIRIDFEDGKFLSVPLVSLDDFLKWVNMARTPFIWVIEAKKNTGMGKSRPLFKNEDVEEALLSEPFTAEDTDAVKQEALAAVRETYEELAGEGSSIEQWVQNTSESGRYYVLYTGIMLKQLLSARLASSDLGVKWVRPVIRDAENYKMGTMGELPCDLVISLAREDRENAGKGIKSGLLKSFLLFEAMACLGNAKFEKEDVTTIAKGTKGGKLAFPWEKRDMEKLDEISKYLQARYGESPPALERSIQSYIYGRTAIPAPENMPVVMEAAGYISSAMDIICILKEKNVKFVRGPPAPGAFSDDSVLNDNIIVVTDDAGDVAVKMMKILQMTGEFIPQLNVISEKADTAGLHEEDRELVIREEKRMIENLKSARSEYIIGITKLLREVYGVNMTVDELFAGHNLVLRLSYLDMGSHKVVFKLSVIFMTDDARVEKLEMILANKVAKKGDSGEEANISYREVQDLKKLEAMRIMVDGKPRRIVPLLGSVIYGGVIKKGTGRDIDGYLEEFVPGRTAWHIMGKGTSIEKLEKGDREEIIEIILRTGIEIGGFMRDFHGYNFMIEKSPSSGKRITLVDLGKFRFYNILPVKKNSINLSDTGNFVSLLTGFYGYPPSFSERTDTNDFVFRKIYDVLREKYGEHFALSVLMSAYLYYQDKTAAIDKSGWVAPEPLGMDKQPSWVSASHENMRFFTGSLGSFLNREFGKEVTDFYGREDWLISGKKDFSVKDTLAALAETSGAFGENLRLWQEKVRLSSSLWEEEAFRDDILPADEKAAGTPVFVQKPPEKEKKPAVRPAAPAVTRIPATEKNVDVQVEAAKKVIADIKSARSDIILMPGSDTFLAYQESVNRDTSRKFHKSYGQFTYPYSYKYDSSWRENIKAMFQDKVVPLMESEKQKGTFPRVLIYAPLEKREMDEIFSAEGLLSGFSEYKPYVTIINEQDIPDNGIIDNVMHIVLAKAFLNYQRFKDKDFDSAAGTNLVDLLKTLVQPGSIDFAESPRDILDKILNGIISLRVMPIDFTEIREYKDSQDAILRSL